MSFTSRSSLAAVAVIGIGIWAHIYNNFPVIQESERVLTHAAAGRYLNINTHAIFYRTSWDDGGNEGCSEGCRRCGCDAGEQSGSGEPGSRRNRSRTCDEKPVILLLHGFPTSSLDWMDIWPGLQDAGYDLVALDFLGFGLSDKPKMHKYSILEQADIVERAMRSLGVQTFHILAHDYGLSVAQELLARDIEQAHPQWQGAMKDVNGHVRERVWKPTILSVALLNGGAIVGAHRPLITQYLLANKWVGPLLAHVAANEWMFARTLNKVFGPETQLSQAAAFDHWVLLAHKEGWRILPNLLHYSAERKQRRVRWEEALYLNRLPLAMMNGPADPISGEHLFRAYMELRNEFVARLQTVAAVSKAGPPTLSVFADESVLAARRKDFHRMFESRIGHYPQIEAPNATLAAVLEFFAGATIASPPPS